MVDNKKTNIQFKNGQGSEDNSPKKVYKGQETHENMLNVSGREGNENQNHKMPPHTN